MAKSVEFASRRFWLDGGYDRDCVEACAYHPHHKWWTFRLGAVLRPEVITNPDERMVICRGCYVPRCGGAEEQSPCVLPRHHEGSHHFERGHASTTGGKT